MSVMFEGLWAQTIRCFWAERLNSLGMGSQEEATRTGYGFSARPYGPKAMATARRG